MELIVCITVIGLLTAVLVPTWESILASGSDLGCDAVARAIQDGINARVSANKIMGVTPVVPESLDGVVSEGDDVIECRTGEGNPGTTNTCFYDILDANFSPVGWTKTGENAYQYTYGGWKNFEYAAVDADGDGDADYGTFTCVDSSDGSCG